jgi:hypothetical protein
MRPPDHAQDDLLVQASPSKTVGSEAWLWKSVANSSSVRSVLSRLSSKGSAGNSPSNATVAGSSASREANSWNAVRLEVTVLGGCGSGSAASVEDGSGGAIVVSISPMAESIKSISAA